MSVGEDMWRIEETEDSVKFWVGNQGFTVYSRGDSTPSDEHKLMMGLFSKSLRGALNKLKPEPPQ